MSSHFSPRGANCRARLAAGKTFAPQELARQLAWTRREFIRSAAGVALGGSLLPSSLIARAGISASNRKVVVITFGGGAREALRRAQPLTLLVRFAPRQRQKPMNEMLSASHAPAELDPLGSLIDADLGAYYNWLNLQRLPGAEQSSFLVWFEGHNEAIAIGPSLPRGTESNAAAGLEQLLTWAS